MRGATRFCDGGVKSRRGFSVGRAVRMFFFSRYPLFPPPRRMFVSRDWCAGSSRLVPHATHQPTQQITATKSVLAAAAAPSSSSSHQLTDDSWELNLDQAPRPDAAAEPAVPSATLTATSEARLPPGGGNELLAAAQEDGGFTGSLPSPMATGAGGSRVDGGAPEFRDSKGDGGGDLSKTANNNARRLAKREAVVAAVAAARKGYSTSIGNSNSNSSRSSSSRNRKNGEEGWEGAEDVIAGKLVSLSLVDEGGSAAAPPSSSSSPPPEAKVRGAGIAGGGSGPSVAKKSSARGPATALSLMDSLEALSSSGADSIPEIGGNEGSGGVRRDDEDSAEEGESKGGSGGGDHGKPPPAAEVVTVATTTSGKKKKKKGHGGAASKQGASGSNHQQQLDTVMATGVAIKDEESKSKPPIVLADADGAGTDPVTVSGSRNGSGSRSGGLGPVSDATTVVRLAGSPNPSLERGGGGGDSSSSSSFRGGSGAENGLRRLAPNGGRGGGARGRVKS